MIVCDGCKQSDKKAFDIRQTKLELITTGEEPRLFLEVYDFCENCRKTLKRKLGDLLLDYTCERGGKS